MPTSFDYSLESYRNDLAAFGGKARGWFAELSGACLQRFLRQNGRRELSPDALAVFTERLWNAVENAGWPAPLPEGAIRGPQERAFDAMEPIIAEMTTAGADPEQREDLISPTRQLLKACLYGEFTICRESYRQQAADGTCRRQQLAAARGRISGSPCVDCPYYVILTQEQHATLLSENWLGKNVVTYSEAASCFLPEDFRRLRRFVWLHARFGKG